MSNTYIYATAPSVTLLITDKKIEQQRLTHMFVQVGESQRDVDTRRAQQVIIGGLAAAHSMQPLLVPYSLPPRKKF